MSTHLYIPTQPEIDHALETMSAAVAAERQQVQDAGRLTDERKTFFAGRLARITRAGLLLTAGAVDYIDGSGWKVESQSKPPQWKPGADPVDSEGYGPYYVTSDHCSCHDHLITDLDCKHMVAVKAYLRIISAKVDAEITEPMSGAYAIECRTPGLYAVYDRATDIDICGAYYVSRTGKYRPETSHDAGAFARWLATHPVDFYPGGRLERLLRTAPGDKITLRADVYYGSVRSYILSAYHFDGQPWVDLEYTERQEFNPDGWAATLATTGWALTSRPVKQAGVAYHYLLERATADQVRYELTGACGATVERERQARAFDMIAAGDQAGLAGQPQ